jgi:hypothetical protein
MAEESTPQQEVFSFDPPSSLSSEEAEVQAIEGGAPTTEPPESEPQEEEETEAEPQEEEIDETPLSPREQALIARLEKIEGATLAVASEAPKHEMPIVAEQQHDFLEGLDLNEVLGDPAQLNALLGNVYNMALKEASRIALEHAYQTMPATFTHFARQQIELRETVNEFYKQNPELSSRKATVGSVANEIAVEHPEYDVPTLLNESAKQVRKMLGLKASIKLNDKTKVTKPAFVTQKSRGERVRKDDLTELQKEMAELY